MNITPYEEDLIWKIAQLLVSQLIRIYLTYADIFDILLGSSLDDPCAGGRSQLGR